MKDLRPSLSLGKIIYIVVIFGVGAFFLHATTKASAKEIPDSEIGKYVKDFQKQPAISLNTEGRPYWGNPNAKVVIAEFSDFECPYCKLAAFNLKPVLGDIRDKVKLVFINFPLDKSCNSGVQRDMHERACVVAFWAYCAGQQGKFWEFHDEAFDRQPKFSDANLQSIGKKVGLDNEKLQACLKDDATKKAVLSDIDQGIKANVMGTPSIFVNGKPFDAWSWKKVMEAVVNAEENAPPAPALKKDR